MPPSPLKLARSSVGLLLVWTLAVAASADPSKEDVAKADELFKHAVKAMDAGRYAEACPLFAESQRIVPGGGTILNLAVCHEAQGLTATAYVEFKEALRVNEAKKRADRIKIAKEHLADLQGRLSYVRIAPPVALVADSSFETLIDERVVDKSWWSDDHAIDPGTHIIEARANGKKPWHSTFAVAPDSDRKTITVPELEAAPVAAPSASTVAAPTIVPPASSAHPTAPPSDSGGRLAKNITGYTMIGAGLVSVGIGTFLYFQAEGAKNNADSAHAADPHYGADLGGARTQLDWARGTLAAGIIVIGVGTYFVWSAVPKGEGTVKASVSPILAPGFGGFSLTGKF